MAHAHDHRRQKVEQSRPRISDRTGAAEPRPVVPLRYLTAAEAATYLNISRQTLYRLIRTGALAPDGKVGARMRFSVDRLDQAVRGGTLEPSVDTRPERESEHAYPEATAEVCRTRDPKRWPRPIPGAGRLERRPNGPEKECTKGLHNDEGGGGVQRESRAGRDGAARTDTLLRLSRAMGLDQ